jgi:hypothetical protein
MNPILRTIRLALPPAALACGALAMTVLGASAANWTLALTNATQTAPAGATAVFDGVITNDTGGPLSIDVSLGFTTSPASDTFTIEFSQSFLDLDLAVPTSGYSGPLFQISWSAEAVPGTFGEGDLEVSTSSPGDPFVASAGFSLRIPGLATFCLESTGFNATDASVAADDSTGLGVMAYNDPGDGSLRFARASSSGWSTEPVVAGIGSAASPSLVLDGLRKPLIAYYNATSGDLQYAEKTGASWVVSALDTGGDVGREPSLVRDDFGALHVAYYDATNLDLKYAQRLGGSWTTETVDATNAVGRHSAIAADAAGVPFISYFDETNGDLKLARKTGTSWEIETVTSTGSVGTHTDLAVVGGTVYIAFRDETTGAHALRFAYGTPGSWTIEPVDAVGDPGLSASLAVDGFGIARVIHLDALGGIRYGVRTPGVGWEIGLVDGTGTGHASLVLASSGEPFVSYGRSPSALLFASFSSCAVVSVPGEGSTPTALRLFANRPNPFTRSTTIAFELAGPGVTTVRIFDAAGRFVAEPVHQKLPSGLHRIEWPGEDRQGHALPSGIYLYEVRSGGLGRRGRLVLVR